LPEAGRLTRFLVGGRNGMDLGQYIEALYHVARRAAFSPASQIQALPSPATVM
jgi:hypothetical protein